MKCIKYLGMVVLMAFPLIANANTVGSSTMYFEGSLTDEGGGVYTGVLPMVDEATAGIGDGVAGYDLYGEEGASAMFGDDPGSGPVWTSQTISSHDAWPTFPTDTPDWYQYSLELTEDGWAVRNHAGATAAIPWSSDPSTYPARGVPMSGTMDWTNMYAEETDTGAYLPGTGTPEIPGGAAANGGGPAAWDMDWSWGSEVVPLEYPGFSVSISDLGGGNYRVVLTPANHQFDALAGMVPDETMPRANLNDAPAGWGPHSWQGPATGKTNWHARYLADGDYLSAIFPDDAATLTIADLASLSYFTKRPSGTPEGRDWWVQIYTRPTGSGDKSSWYHDRFINNYADHTESDTWTQYSTDSDMTFHSNGLGVIGVSTLAELIAAAGSQEIEMISVQTDSGWDGFDGYLDGLVIELTDGKLGQVDFNVGGILLLDASDASLYIQPSESVTVDMDVLELLQRVNACQAMLGYSSTYFADPTGGCVAPGGGVWDQVIWDSWDISGVTGEIDTAIGVDAQGAVGTDVDGTVAIITLTSNGTEGETQLYFRPDADPDPGLVESTFLSDMDAQPVWPEKIDSQTIVIDGTDPSITDISATQDSGPELTPSGTAIQGDVIITVAASDDRAGLDGIPTVSVTPNGGSTYALSGTDNGDGTFSYTFTVTSAMPNGTAVISVTASDLSGNSASDTDTFNINKNQVTGQVELESLNPTATIVRDVTFVADGGVASWVVPVSFAAGSSVGEYTLADVPDGVSAVSAKADWNLRVKLDGLTPVDGQITANFTSSDALPGGDLDGSNSVNILDYSILRVNYGPNHNPADPVADIDGDDITNSSDYLILRSNFFTVGDDL